MWLVVVLILAAGGVAWGRVPDFSENERVQMSDWMLEDIRQDAGPPIDVKLDDPLHGLFMSLTALARLKVDFRLQVLPIDAIDAFGLPDGRVIITRGLLDRVPRATLAFVLAHQIAHIDGHHAEAQVNVSASSVLGVISQLPIGGRVGSWVSVASGAARSLIKKGYPRDLELATDRLALDLLRRAHLDPNLSLELLQIAGKAGPAFPTHPPLDVRCQNVLAWMQEAHVTVRAPVDYIDRAHLFRGDAEARSGDAVDRFQTQEIINLELHLKNAVGRRLRIEWRCGDMVLHEVDRVLSSDGRFVAHLANRHPWRPGRYEARILVDGSLVRVLPFAVQEAR